MNREHALFPAYYPPPEDYDVRRVYWIALVPKTCYYIITS